MNIGVARWERSGGIGSVFLAAVESLGHDAVPFSAEGPLPGGLDAVLTYGPFGSLVPLTQAIRSRAPGDRPGFVLWQTEQLPNPALPEWVRRPTGVLRSGLERWSYGRGGNGPGPGRLLRSILGRGLRFRYYGDLYWLRGERLLSGLVIGSQWTAEFLRARGFEPIIGYIGSHHSWGRNLELERDIPVLWIGNRATRRRRRLLGRVRGDLRRRGIEMLMVDGEENDYIFGEMRTKLLNRTKVVINFMRAPWDCNALRHFLAAHNGAVIISEPSLPHTPFVDGVHFVEAPVESMADTICHYLAHDVERLEIAKQARRLVTKELSFEQSLAASLRRIEPTLAPGRSTRD